MPGTRRAPLTAEQWGLIDAAWLAGDSAPEIVEETGIPYRQVRYAVPRLGHTFVKRQRCRGPVTWTPEKQREYKAKYDCDRLIEYKRMVFDHYGARCICCGEDTLLFLTIDHKNNDGAEHRRQMKQATLYEAVVKMGFPDSFQIMCLNCNRGRWLNGGMCPHVTPAWTGFHLEGVG